MNGSRRGDARGFGSAVAAYALWGLFPLFWPLLEPAGPVELLAHRVVWSFVFMLILLTCRRQWSWVRKLMCTPALLVKTVLASVVITANWCLYIWGVNSGRVVESSLGYFINPLVFIAIGLVVFGERLRAAQWVAVGLAVVAVLVLTVSYGRMPWLALALAGSFSFYGYVKKTSDLGPIESLAVETAVVLPPAVGYLGYLAWTGEGTFGTVSTGHTLMLLSVGVVASAPVLFFTVAAARLPLSMMGMLHYLEPVLQFVLGVCVFREEMPAFRWAGFGLIWVALAILGTDALHAVRGPRLRTRSASARTVPSANTAYSLTSMRCSIASMPHLRAGYESVSLNPAALYRWWAASRPAMVHR